MKKRIFFFMMDREVELIFNLSHKNVKRSKSNYSNGYKDNYKYFKGHPLYVRDWRRLSLKYLEFK